MENDSQDVPKLRFPNFDEEWDESKIDDIFNIKVAGDIKKDLFNETKSEKFKYPLYANSIEDEGLLGYYSEYKYNPNSITITARGINIGYAINREEKFMATGRLLILEPKYDINNQFFTEYLNNKLKIVIESTGVPQLTAPSLKINKIKFPALSEQNQIGGFLTLINKKIEVLERKHISYVNFKKFLMNFIFTEKSLFNIDDCDIVKLSQITKIGTGKKDVKDKKDDGEYPFFVRSEKIERIDSYSYDGEAILIPGDGKIGEIIHYINGKFDFHQRVYKISDFTENVNGKYIYYYLEKNFLRQALRNTAKATVDSLRLSTLTDMPIELPTLDEQMKIVNILSVADRKIELLDKELNITKEFKRGLMQKMFV